MTGALPGSELSPLSATPPCSTEAGGAPLPSVADVVLELLGKIRRAETPVGLRHRLDALEVSPVDLLTVLLAVEARFGVELSDEVLETIQTVGEFVTLVDQAARKAARY
ncbi:MAG TPA: acyl carrier protein [Acidiferrobacteraceae bacterium]|nr:acyl carrier protein [Acidiferrobacteraceae bacterium]